MDHQDRLNELFEGCGVDWPSAQQLRDEAASRGWKFEFTLADSDAPVDHTAALAALTARVHSANRRWWLDLVTNEPKARNVGEMLMLVVTEIAEGMEGYRKNLPDDHLPQFPMLTVELADALIRIFDIAGGLGLDLAGAFEAKMAYNAGRADHTREARLAPGGKKV